ncbi:hypothetical protein SMACR_12774 [Sordaria macrospora]|uniref:WGS project CABT00000000 data, contig 2.4 n=2 Tax=Sordaria macrospora TaxID=5147 RepID=F7VRD1_SORMK|nr:uncharacterized protein SMAC_12774 [Sordaria macrospora k-hell]KAA8635265.1 hypothetical protein SMACR_12774 [Sordaria macrospora]WPJ58483.1 hypothetical protein SMAC4_12774 [Sordaria macrospora]CCC08066.1 unnamed protein product [Sordaria macrospora k-hell]
MSTPRTEARGLGVQLILPPKVTPDLDLPGSNQPIRPSSS